MYCCVVIPMLDAKDVDKDYMFYLTADLREYAGKWIATVDEMVIAFGSRADEVMKEAERKCPDKVIALSKVPTDDLLILSYR